MTSWKFYFPYFLFFSSFIPFLADFREAGTVICLEGMDSGLRSLEAIVNVGKLLTSMSVSVSKKSK